MSGLGIICRRLMYRAGCCTEQLPRCDLLRLIPALGGFVLSERRDLELCAGTVRGIGEFAQSATVSSSRTSAFSIALETVPLNRNLYCYKGIPFPEGEHEASAPATAPCLPATAKQAASFRGSCGMLHLPPAYLNSSLASSSCLSTRLPCLPAFP